MESQNSAPSVSNKTKKPKYEQKYSSSWNVDPDLKGWLVEKPKGCGFCTLCNSSLQIKAGKTDLVKHAASAKHKNLMINLKQQPKISAALAVSLKTKDQTKELELRLTAFCCEHNLPFTIMDHLVKIFKNSNCDGEVTKALACNRTKTIAITKNVLGLRQKEIVCEILRKNKFSLCIDESTDIASEKTLSVVARVSHCFEVHDFFFALVPVVKADATTLYNSITDILITCKIDYKRNLIGFAADGANNMTGGNHSVAKLLKDDCPNLFILKCICHSFNLCAANACKKLPSSVECLARDVYNYLENSAKRTIEFNQIQSLLDFKPRKMIHPSQTRWLSLENVVLLLLDRYECLKIFFGFQANIDELDRAKNILESLKNHLNKMYLQFLGYVLPIINKLNKLFQSESPKIFRLHFEITRLTKTILDNYIERDYLLKIKIEDVEFSNEMYFLPYDNLYLGAAVDVSLNELKDISSDDIFVFKTHCLKFYTELVSQIYKRFDFKSKIWQSISCIDPANVILKRQSSIAALCQCFPNLIEASEMQNIDSEWRELRNIDLTDFETSDAELFWKQVARIETGESKLAFPILSTFVFQLLSLPNSSACVERTFSQINLNKTKIRNRLQTSTLSGILLCKEYLKSNNETCASIKLNGDLKSKLFSENMY